MSDKVDIEALKEYLPFYVNGTIKPDDKAAVEEGLAVSSDLRAALVEERKLQAKFNRSMDAELATVSGAAQAGEPCDLARTQRAVAVEEQHDAVRGGEPQCTQRFLRDAFDKCFRTIHVQATSEPKLS